jgi:hypothetical protein
MNSKTNDVSLWFDPTLPTDGSLLFAANDNTWDCCWFEWQPISKEQNHQENL